MKPNLHSSGDKGTESIDAVLHDLRELMTVAEERLGHAAGADSAPATPSTRERLESLQERLAAAYVGAKRRIGAGTKRADETIRAHPYGSLTLALGVGVLIGVLVNRSRKPA